MLGFVLGRIQAAALSGKDIRTHKKPGRHFKGLDIMDWKVTATKLYCDVEGLWVTIMVYADGNVKCGRRERKVASGQNRGQVLCPGDEKCIVMTSYKEDVFQRERQNPEPAGDLR